MSKIITLSDLPSNEVLLKKSEVYKVLRIYKKSIRELEEKKKDKKRNTIGTSSSADFFQ